MLKFKFMKTFHWLVWTDVAPLNSVELHLFIPADHLGMEFLWYISFWLPSFMTCQKGWVLEPDYMYCWCPEIIEKTYESLGICSVLLFTLPFLLWWSNHLCDSLAGCLPCLVQLSPSIPFRADSLTCWLNFYSAECSCSFLSQLELKISCEWEKGLWSLGTDTWQDQVLSPGALPALHPTWHQPNVTLPIR